MAVSDEPLEDLPLDGHFDYLIIGTGLSDSILAHSLAAQPQKPSVLQLDPNSHYGQSWAALPLDKFHAAPLASSSSVPDALPPDPRPAAYALSLQPALVPARGKFVDSLVSANVAPYLSFQLLHAFFLCQPDQTLVPVPGSKHDLFRAQGLSLVDKRCLMRFFRALLDLEPFSPPHPHESLASFVSRPPYLITNPEVLSVLSALALSPQADPPAAPVLSRLRTLFGAIGRHVPVAASALPAALLLGEYGGGGEWVEGYVRAAAVTGGAVQVLGRPVLALDRAPGQTRWKVALGPQAGQPSSGGGLCFSAARLLVSQTYVGLLSPPPPPPDTVYHVLRAIAVVGAPGLDLLETRPPAESARRPGHALVVFPPAPGRGAPAYALVVGPDAGSCPADEQLAYLSTTSVTPANPAETLGPVLKRLIQAGCSTGEEALKYTRFYNQPVEAVPDPKTVPEDVVVVPCWPQDIERGTLTEVVEWAIEIGEEMIEKVCT